MHLIQWVVSHEYMDNLLLLPNKNSTFHLMSTGNYLKSISVETSVHLCIVSYDVRGTRAIIITVKDLRQGKNRKWFTC